MGALAGASKSRPGRIPSAEIGGGAGAGVGAAVGRPGLQARLQREFRPSVEKAIRDAYKRHAPEALGGAGKVTQ